MQYQRHLIAIREFRAPVALSPDLSGELGLVYESESALFEERRLIGQAENAGDAQFSGFLKAFVDKTLADALALITFFNCQRFDLGEVHPAHVKRHTGNHLVSIPDHEIVPDILVNLAQGARKHLALISEFVDKLMHLGCVSNLSLFYIHLGLLFLFQLLH
jgi:hypothetical protein